MQLRLEQKLPWIEMKKKRNVSLLRDRVVITSFVLNHSVTLKIGFEATP